MSMSRDPGAIVTGAPLSNSLTLNRKTNSSIVSSSVGWTSCLLLVKRPNLDSSCPGKMRDLFPRARPQHPIIVRHMNQTDRGRALFQYQCSKGNTDMKGVHHWTVPIKAFSCVEHRHWTANSVKYTVLHFITPQTARGENHMSHDIEEQWLADDKQNLFSNVGNFDTA